MSANDKDGFTTDTAPQSKEPLSPEWPDGRSEATWFIDLLPGLDLSGSKDSPDE